MLVGISIEERNTRSSNGHCKTAPNHRSINLKEINIMIGRLIDHRPFLICPHIYEN